MYIVDRISEDIMVCEDLVTNDLVKLPLIENAKEGCYIKIVDNRYIIDEEMTTKKRNEIKSKLSYLQNRQEK